MINLAAIIKEEKGQGMTEYAIVCLAIVAALVLIDKSVVPPLNDLYELMANLISIPFP